MIILGDILIVIQYLSLNFLPRIGIKDFGILYYFLNIEETHYFKNYLFSRPQYVVYIEHYHRVNTLLELNVDIFFKRAYLYIFHHYVHDKILPGLFILILLYLLLLVFISYYYLHFMLTFVAQFLNFFTFINIFFKLACLFSFLFGQKSNRP